MRLDAANGMPDISYFVYDAEECELRRDVRWVDDETAQWGQLVAVTFAFLITTPICTTRQAKQIKIYPERKLVIINPVADDVDESTETTQAVGVKA